MPVDACNEEATSGSPHSAAAAGTDKPATADSATLTGLHRPVRGHAQRSMLVHSDRDLEVVHQLRSMFAAAHVHAIVTQIQTVQEIGDVQLKRQYDR